VLLDRLGVSQVLDIKKGKERPSSQQIAQPSVTRSGAFAGLKKGMEFEGYHEAISL